MIKSIIPPAFAQQKIGGEITPIGPYAVDDPATNLSVIFSNLLAFFTYVAGLAFVIYFVIGALSWLTAGGDTQKADKAKTYMTNAAIGLIIVVAAYGIISIVGTVLGINILNPGEMINNLGPNTGPQSPPRGPDGFI